MALTQHCIFKRLGYGTNIAYIIIHIQLEDLSMALTQHMSYLKIECGTNVAYELFENLSVALTQHMSYLKILVWHKHSMCIDQSLGYGTNIANMYIVKELGYGKNIA